MFLSAKCVHFAGTGSILLEDPSRQESIMRQRPFGLTRRPVPVIGQGTWYIEEASRSAAVAAMLRGIGLGMSHIDTAELYGGGAAEEIVAEAIAGRRNKVFLVS